MNDIFWPAEQIEMEASPLFLKPSKKTEAMGGDPLGDLAKQIMYELSERKIQLEIARGMAQPSGQQFSHNQI